MKKYKNPSIKVVWKDTPENFTPEKLKRVKTYFQNKYGTRNVRVVTENQSMDQTTYLKSLEVSDNILDQQYQKTLMKDFITNNKIDIKWDMVDRLDNRVNGEINKLNENKVRYNKWYINKVEFSNFLSYGENNVVNYSEMDGLTVVESSPKNFGGKTVLSVDIIMFLFFNTTTKTKTNSEIFNKYTDKDEVTVKGYIVIDDVDYIIERKLIRKKSKSGEYTISSKLDYFKVNTDGTTENLTGEQRRETEAFITSAIGTEEDFLTTIVTTGNNLEQLIESKPTARGQILTKFMGLESLKEKEEIAKGIYNEWSKKLTSNTYNIVQLESDNTKLTEEIENTGVLIVKLENELVEHTTLQKTLESRRDELLSNRNNNIDRELMNINPVQIQNEINDLRKQQETILNLSKSVIVTEPSKYYLEDKHDELRKKISTIQGDIRLINDEISRAEKNIKSFEEGSVCPTCKRALENVDHTKEIEKIKEEIVVNKGKIDKLNSNLELLNKEEQTFKLLKVEFETYEKNKLIKTKHELEHAQKQVLIDNKQLKLDNYELNKKKLDDNQKIDTELVGIKTRIETVLANINQNGIMSERYGNSMKAMRDKIVVNIDLIKKINTENELLSVFKVYLSIYGKNGISKVILKNMIPLLNQELQRLLVDSCYFNLELSINDKNEVEFIMIDNETRVPKPLNAGSGYEKTISSLALRSVLTKISSLPKPNIVVMDEVFGKIADENLEMVGEFFKKIKNYFEHILIISHNPLIRNWSDNVLMVKKEDNISSIDFISLKN
jgi:DNA repair exonuclease SbcCD ATPase subunit